MKCPKCGRESFVPYEDGWKRCLNCSTLVDTIHPMTMPKLQKSIIHRHRNRAIDVVSAEIRASVESNLDKITKMLDEIKSYSEINSELGFTWGKAATKKHYERAMTERGSVFAIPRKRGKVVKVDTKAALEKHKPQILKMRLKGLYWQQIKDELSIPGAKVTIAKYWREMECI